VISLLNRYFVPVYSSNEETGPTGKASSGEKAERNRIYQEQFRTTGSVGEVFVYILSPDGHPIDGLDIGRATQPPIVIQRLERTVQTLKLAPGEPVVNPVRGAAPPVCLADSVVLHLVARGFRNGNWREFPGENWIVLTHSEWTRLFPAVAVRAGTSWNLDKDLTTKLLTGFYPPTEDTTSAERNRFDQESLTATLLSTQKGIARVRIEGNLRMKRTFYPNKADDNFVNAALLGFMAFETDSRRMDTFKLVTKQATYGSAQPEEFGAGLEMVNSN
jgi:hypothetical protein